MHLVEEHNVTLEEVKVIVNRILQGTVSKQIVAFIVCKDMDHEDEYKFQMVGRHI